MAGGVQGYLYTREVPHEDPFSFTTVNKTMKDRSPVKLIAFRLFAESFGDLVSIRAQITPFERGLIEGTYEILWLDMFDNLARSSWAQTLRAAFKILDNGALKEPQAVWEAYTKIANRIVPALHQVFDRRSEIKRKQVGEDALIEGYLSAYKSIYERLLPLIFKLFIGNDQKIFFFD